MIKTIQILSNLTKEMNEACQQNVRYFQERIALIFQVVMEDSREPCVQMSFNILTERIGKMFSKHTRTIEDEGLISLMKSPHTRNSP
jgi:hypothetical protein